MDVLARHFHMLEGICAGEVKRDRQHTRFFELMDNEGNTLEACEQPEGFWRGNLPPSY